MFSLLLLISLLVTIKDVYSIGNTRMKTARVSQCPDAQKYAARIINIKTYIVEALVYFDVDFNVTKNLPNDIKLTITAQKCANQESLDTCVSFSKPTLNNCCKRINDKNQIWSPIVSCLKPIIVCPLKKGMYFGRNCTIDLRALKFLPLTNFYWRLKTEFKDSKNNDILACYNSEGSMTTSTKSGK